MAHENDVITLKKVDKNNQMIRLRIKTLLKISTMYNKADRFLRACM